MNKQSNPLLKDKSVSSATEGTHASTDAILTDDERRKMRKAALIKILAMTLFVLVVLIFSSIAWFTMNKEVEGQQVNMTATDLPFDIQTIGSQHQSKEALLTAKGYTSGAAVTSSGTTIGNQTTAEDGCIYWMLTSDDDMYKGIRPGKSGKIEFYIIPKDPTSQLTANCQINIEPYKLKTVLNSEGKEVVADPNELVLLGSGNSPRPAETKTVDLVKGHILFFSDYTPSTGLYTGRIKVEEDAPLSITVNPSDLDESGRYKVTIYWIWPVTLSRILDYNGAAPICSGSDQTELISYVQKAPDNFFDISSSSTESAVIEIVGGVRKLKSSVLDTSSETGLKKHFGELSVSYNNGDLDIGVNAEYILVEALVY